MRARSTLTSLRCASGIERLLEWRHAVTHDHLDRAGNRSGLRPGRIAIRRAFRPPEEFATDLLRGGGAQT
jgi:hypothetical protein